MKQWYKELFENYADTYDNEDFTKGTIGEVDFIEKEIDYDKSKEILDVGCGTGRHSLELARRGYRVTGIDLSESMLSKAQRIADSEKLKVEFISKDARNFDFNEKYDTVIMLCEGAFPLMETDEMNYKILKNIYNSLRKGGKFIFTTLNGLFPLFHSVEEFINKSSPKNTSSENTFDLMSFRDYSIYETVDDKGKKKKLHCNERYYVPSEMTWLLKSLKFNPIDIHGCQVGIFSRTKKLTPEDFEMLVITGK